MANMTTSIMGVLRARNPALCEQMPNGGASFDLCQERAKFRPFTRDYLSLIAYEFQPEAGTML